MPKLKTRAKVTFAKIPQSQKEIGAIACNRFAVFGRTILSVSPAFEALERKRSGVPAHGYITIKGERFYYCFYGFVDDPSIYE